MNNLNNWLTPLALEEEFGFSKSTQAKYRMSKKIPFSKVGGYVMQKTEQIGHQRRSQFGQHNVKHSVSMTEMIRSLFKKTVL